jgi:PhnB protein
MATINPYLNFSGNCEEAFTFYKSVFGGEFDSFSRMGEAPSDGELSASEANQIMHVGLPIGHGTTLMGSDRPASMGPTTVGNNYHISIQTDSAAETDRIFNGLAAGGQVLMPVQETFWNARFGMLIDKYGVQWMLNEAHQA